MSGIYSDPRYEALGLTDTTQARAADQFYGSVPMAMGPMGGYGGQMGGFQDEEDLQVAYEQDIVRRLGQIDPTAPDYEFKVQEFFANEPDPDAAGYGRVRLAANALLGRSGLLKQTAQQSLAQQKEAQKREIELRSQLAENGFDPQRFREITDEKGRLKIDDAYYQLGQLKRTNGQSGKYNPASLTSQETEELIKNIAPLNIEPTDEEKVLAWQQSTGTSDRPQTTQQWTDAYNAVMNPRKQQAQGLIRTYQQLGRQVPAGILSQAGIQPSVVSSSPTAQSNPQAAIAPVTTETVVAASTVDPNSPNITFDESFEATNQANAQAVRTASQQALDNQWSTGKQSMENNLLARFKGDRNKLNQFYRSVVEEELSSKNVDPLSGYKNSVLDTELVAMGYRPGERSPDLNLDRGFGQGGWVTNEDLLRSLAQDRLSYSTPQSESLPRPQSKEERDALPSGARYVAPNGQILRKQ